MASNIPMKKNTACTIVFPIFDADGDPVVSAAGLDSEYSVDGGAFADCTNEASQIGTSGIYTLALVAAETNGDVVCIQVKTSTTGAKTSVLVFYTASQTASELKTSTDAIDTVVDAIKAKTDNLPSDVQKGVALSKFGIFMVLSADHLTPATGKTVAVTISKDGGAFGACTNSPATEISGGWYYIDLTATEMNAKIILLSASSATCDTRPIGPIITSI